MNNSSLKGWMEHTRRAVSLMLVVAAGGRIAWVLLAPVLPMLATLAVALAVLGVSLYGRRSK
jgi:hypothetical protein